MRWLHQVQQGCICSHSSATCTQAVQTCEDQHKFPGHLVWACLLEPFQSHEPFRQQYSEIGIRQLGAPASTAEASMLLKVLCCT